MWDTLLLHPPCFSVFVALSILITQRAKLLQLDFNGCIMFFSNIVALDLESCLAVALLAFHSTPASFYDVAAAGGEGRNDRRLKHFLLDSNEAALAEDDSNVPLQDSTTAVSPSHGSVEKGEQDTEAAATSPSAAIVAEAATLEHVSEE